MDRPDCISCGLRIAGEQREKREKKGRSIAALLSSSFTASLLELVA